MLKTHDYAYGVQFMYWSTNHSYLCSWLHLSGTLEKWKDECDSEV